MAYNNSNNHEIYGTNSYSSFDEAYSSRNVEKRPESQFNPDDYIETDEIIARKLQDEYNKEAEYIESDEALARKIQSESEVNTNHIQNDHQKYQSTYSMNIPQEFSEDTTSQPHRYVSYENERPMQTPVRNNLYNSCPLKQYYPINAGESSSFEERRIKNNISPPQINKPSAVVSEPIKHEINSVSTTGLHQLTSQPFVQQQQQFARAPPATPRQVTVEQKPITQTELQQFTQKSPQVPVTPEPTRTSKALENALIQVQPQNNAPLPPPPPPPPILSDQIRRTTASKDPPTQSLSEALSNVKLRPVAKSPEGAANTDFPKNRIPTSELLREIKQCKLRHVAQSIPADLDEEDAGEFAATLSHLIKERRIAISGNCSEEEESSNSQEW
jgi:hypothetical protein